MRTLGLLAFTAALSTPVSAATTFQWVGPNLGAASNSSNWSPVGVPATGDSVVFNSGANECTWDLAVSPVNVTVGPGYTGIVGFQPATPIQITGAFVINTGRVEFRDGYGPFTLTKPVTVTGGTFHVGMTTVTVVAPSSMTFTGGALDLHDLALLKADRVDIRAAAALNMYDNGGGFTGGPTLTGATTAGLNITVAGTLNVSSGAFQHLAPAGLVINPGATIISLSTLTFQGPLFPGATAINFPGGGTFTSTFTNVQFLDANIAVDVNAAALTGGRITLRGAKGPRAGPSYENDPNGRVDWPGFVSAPPGCATTVSVKQDGSGDFTTVQAAVDAITAGLTGDYCISIGDGATYNELAVQGKATNGHRLVIGSFGGPRPTFSASGPGVAAVVAIANSSVTLVNAAVAGSVPHQGIVVSSDNAVLSGVYVDYAGGGTLEAAVTLSSWSLLTNSSITVAAGANQTVGLRITGTGSGVIQSTVAGSGSPLTDLVELQSATTNFILQSYLYNDQGKALVLGPGADHNTITQSTMIAKDEGVHIGGGSYNTFALDVIKGTGGTQPAFRIDTIVGPSDNNTILMSTISVNSASVYALDSAASNALTVTMTNIMNPSGGGATIHAYAAAGDATFTQVGIFASSSVANGLDVYYAGAWTSGAVIHGSTAVAANHGTLGFADSFFYAGGPGAAALALTNATDASLTGVGLRGGRFAWDGNSTVSVNGLDFLSMPAGSTAIDLTQNATYVATFTAVNFADANIAVDVEGGLVDANFTGSRLTMANASGSRAGPAFEHDPNAFIDWPGFQGPLSFSGVFNDGGATAARPAFNDYGQRVLVDTVSVGGPFVYVLVHSTSATLGYTPDAAALVKYDGAGVMLASTTLLGNDSGPAMTLDGAGRIYVGERSKASDGVTITGKWLSKYSPALVLLAKRDLSDAVNGVSALVSDGTNVYAAHDGVPSFTSANAPARLVKYGPNLVPLSTATYANGTDPVYARSLARDAAGNLYLDVFSTSEMPSATRGHHILKYGPSFNGASPLASVLLTFPFDYYQGNLAVAGSGLYYATYDGSYPTNAFIRKFDLNLNYTGVSSTYTAAANPNGLSRGAALVRGGPDGNVYLMASAFVADGGDFVALKYDQNLNLLASASFGGTAGGADQAYDLAVADPAHVYLTGAAPNVNADADAVTTVLNLTGSPETSPFNFNGAFGVPAGASVFAAGRNTGGSGVAVDSVSANGPFVYAVVVSTTGSLYAQPHAAALVKYGPDGVMVASATLSGTAEEGDGVVVSSSGYVFVSERTPGQSTISEYDPSLNFVTSAVLSASVGPIKRMATDGTYLYAGADSGVPGMGAQVLQYDLWLNFVNSVMYEGNAGYDLLQGLAADGQGNAFAVVATVASGPPYVQRLIKLDSGLYVVADVDLSAVTTAAPALAVAGVNLYMASADGGSRLAVRKFDAQGNFTGLVSTFPFSSTFGSAAALQAGPDGNLYAAGLSTATPVLRLDQSLRLLSAAPFGGLAEALAVLDSSGVYATGARLNATGRFEALTRRLNLSGGLAGYVPALDVAVKTSTGAPLPGIQVSAVRFSTAGPDGYLSRTAVTDSSGVAHFNPGAGNWLADGARYDLFATAQGYLPGLRDQFNNPAHPVLVSVPGVNLPPAVIVLNPVVPSTSTIGRGEIDVDLVHATANSLLFGSVQPAAPGSPPAAIGLVKTDASGAGTLQVFNVPYASTNAYTIGALDSAANKTAGRPVDLELAAYRPLIAYSGGAGLDFANALPPTRVGGSGTAAADGLLISTDGIAAAGLNVQFDYLSASGSTATLRVASDRNGRFQLFGLTAGTTYYAKVFSGCGVNGCFDGAFSTYAAFGDAPGANDILYTGAAQTRIVVLNRSSGAGGRLAVYVRDLQGNPLPQSRVSLFPDGFNWCTVADCTVAPSSPGPASAVAPATTGYALIGPLPSGNYTLQVYTQLSTSPVTYNDGADGAPSSSGGACGRGDDLRLTIDAGSPAASASAYDGCGAAILVGASSITLVAGSAAQTTGLVKGSFTFPAAEDLSGDPITIALQPQCAGGPCSGGGYAVIAGTVAKTGTFAVRVASGAVYALNVSANYWGVADRGAGRRSISLVSTGTAIVNLDFLPAGRATGKVYRPDGSLFTPGPDAAGGYTGAMVLADGSNASGFGPVNPDGTFSIGGLLPGAYGLRVAGFGAGFAYTDRLPLPKAVVVAGKDAYLDANLLAGANMIVTADTTTLPALPGAACPPDSDFECPPQQFVVDAFPRGTDLAKRAAAILNDEDQAAQFAFRLSTFSARCDGLPGADGFCPARLPSPTAVDLHLLRKGRFDQADYGHVRPYFTVLNSSRSVVADAALAAATGFWKGSTVAFQTVDLTPAVSLAGAGEATLSGAVSGTNIFRQQDFDSFGGQFANFIKFLPVVAVYDPAGSFAGAGLVTPVPSCFAQPGVQAAFDQAIAANSLAQFKAVFASGGPCFNGGAPFGYEIRGLTPGTTYTAVFSSPNYPPYQAPASLAAAGSTTTLNVNLDLAAGAGGTLTGVVKSTAGVVLANVSVTVQSGATDAKTAVTNALGVYAVPGLPKGAYRLSASAAGYASADASASVSGAVTVNFALRAAASSISGTVYAQTVPSVQVEAGAQVFAYNDTYNAAHPGAPLTLYQTATDADGLYTLDGLESGQLYKIFLKVPGHYVANQSTLTAAGAVTGIDFIVQDKPADVQIFGRRADPYYEFTVRNPDAPQSERAWISTSPYDALAAVEVTASFADLPDDKRLLDYPLASLTTGQDYVLHIEAAFASGESVTREFVFGRDRASKSRQHIDDKILGDGSDDAQGNASNEARIDESGSDPSAVVIPPGAMIPASDDAVPELSFEAQDPAGAPESAVLGTTAPFAGSIYRIGLSSVNLTDRGFDLSLAYDVNAAGGAKDLVVAHYAPEAVRTSALVPKCLWGAVPGAQSLDALSGAITVVGLKSFAGVLSVPRRVRAASDGRGYRPNGRYRVESALDSGTYAVLSASKLASSAPSAPVATGTAVGADSILWTWPKVATAQYYRLYPSTGGDPFDVTPNYYLMTGLSTGTVYSLKVSAVNTCNEGALSKAATTYALAAAPTGTAVDPVTVSSASALATWTDGVNPGGTTYKVEWYKAAAPAAVSSKLVTTPYAGLTGLTPNTSYYVRVRALNAKLVAGLYDAPAPFWTLPLRVTAAPLPKFAPTAASAANPNTLILGSATWTWAAVPNAQYYNVFEIAGGTFDLTSPTQVVAAPSATLTSLSPNTPYGVRVQAGNTFFGVGPLSAAVTGYALADTPAGFAATPGSGAVALTWNAGANPLTVTYKVEFKKSSAAAWTAATVTPDPGTFPAVSKVITGLTAGTNYDFRVRALNKSLVPGVPVAATLVQPNAAKLAAAAPSWDWNVPAAQVKAAAASSSAALVRVLAFPNPLLPGQPGVSFVNLPAGATVKISNALGSLVREFTAGSSGSVLWNGSDARGRKAPNGTYPALIQSGSASRTIDVSVQR